MPFHHKKTFRNASLQKLPQREIEVKVSSVLADQTARCRSSFIPTNGSYVPYTLPETNIAPKNGWLEYAPFLLGFGLFSGAFTVSFREGFPLTIWGGIFITSQSSNLQFHECQFRSKLTSSFFYHRENAGTLGMVPLIINPIYTLYSGYLLGISPFKGLFGGLNS